MKNYKNITAILVLLIVALSCAKEKDPVDLSYIGAPTNVAVGFDITQDNTGLVTIVPNAEGVASYRILFGDEEGGQPTEFAVGEVITHAYEEGNYTVGVTAVGITGLTTTVEENITVTFKAPENLEVTITQDPVNPAVVTVSATADFATVMDIYWGVEPGEEPVTVLPGQDTTHTYQESGDYVITVEAKSGGSATTLFSETITVPEASDPVNLPIDFESFTVNYAFENFGMAEASVIDNPDPSGINTSSRVAQMVKPEGAETWAGAFLTMENPIDFSTNTTFRMKVWSPKSGAIVKLKAENLENGDIGYEIDAVTTTSNAWEELEYDFSGINTAESYQKVVVFFDFDNPGDGSIYYFDDIKLVPGMVPPTSMIEDFEGEPPVFNVFGNIPDVEVLANPDPSGLNTTATVGNARIIVFKL
jgi:hypothetical protein